ncbi:MAG: DUF3696 domain-containing protein [Chloroflexi bacterium]|nr:DUF3696 domain-containing protein [Chloroflexota bacterium]
MLRRIGLSNFKCWRELDIELAPITLLFGANSSGKTAILQSLLMLKQTARGFDPGQHINFGDGDRDYVNLGSYRDLAYRHDERNSVEMNVKWDSRTGISWQTTDGETGASYVREIKSSKPINYNVSWAYSDQISIHFLGYSVCTANRKTENLEIEKNTATGAYVARVFQPPQSNDLATAIITSPPESCFVFPDKMLIQFPIDVQRFAAFYMREFEEFTDRLMYLAPLRAAFKRQYFWTGGKPKIVAPDGANSIDFLISSVRDDRQLLEEVEDLLRSLAVVEAFDVKSIDRNERLYEATATIAGVESSLSDVGFGISQVLPVITMLMSAPEGSIILLEQPELHLHPNAQAALADLMLEVAETRNLQLIVESHSEHIVRRLQRRIAEASPAFATPENIKMYYCQPGEGGATIDEVDMDRFGQISNWPEKFLGDISGDIHSMSKAAFKRLHQERVGV